MHTHLFVNFNHCNYCFNRDHHLHNHSYARVLLMWQTHTVVLKLLGRKKLSRCIWFWLLKMSAKRCCSHSLWDLLHCTAQSRFGWRIERVEKALMPSLTWEWVYAEFFFFFPLQVLSHTTCHKNEQGVQAYHRLFASQSANTMMRHLTEQTQIVLTEHDTYVGALWHSINRPDEGETPNRIWRKSEIIKTSETSRRNKIFDSVAVTCALCICIRLHLWISESFHVLAWNWTIFF